VTRQRINLQVDRVTVAGGRISERSLADAIRTELGTRLHGLNSADLVGQARMVAVLDGGKIAGRGSDDLSTAVGRAVARATTGAIVK